MSRDIPVKVKNISLKPIFYNNQRYRPGDIFYINKATDFSKRGVMVCIDEDDKEILHLGGYDDRGSKLKGSPVFPGQDVQLPSQTEQEKEDRETELRANIKRDEEELAGLISPLPYVPVKEEVPEEEESQEATIVEKVSEQNVI